MRTILAVTSSACLLSACTIGMSTSEFKPSRSPHGVRTTVSTAGGIQPRWSLDGHELFYISRSNEMMRVHVTAGQTATLDFNIPLPQGGSK